MQAYLRDGRFSVGHAKVILGLPGVAEQRLAAERVIKHGLNVRQTEELVTRLQKPAATQCRRAAPARAPAPARCPCRATSENRLRERFGTKVQLRYRQGKGAMEIRFFSDDELERILQIVGVKVD